TLGLDVETGYEVRELLRRISREEGKTILLSTHDMQVVQDLCERTVIIDQGKVVVDDAVGNLLRLFATRAYTVTVADHLSGAQKARLAQRFPLLTLEEEAGSTLLRVDLDGAREIYELIEILRLERSPIETIDRTAIDFEEVFRHLVN